MENSKSKKSNTGYKGIYFDKDCGKFRSRLSIDKHYFKHIGMYNTLNEAKKEREAFIKNLF